MSSRIVMEKYLSSPIYTRGIWPAVLGALSSVLLVAFVAWAATTIGNNIDTAGTLSVTGASTLTGTTTLAGALYASSTVLVDGILENTRNVNFGSASGTPTVTGLNVTGDAYVTSGLGVGYATTSDGNLLVSNLGVFQSRLGVSATTSPTVEFGVTGSGLFSGGLGVGYATTGSGHLLVSGLAVFQSSGRLGYGTTSPYAEVGIAGDVAIGGSIGTSTVSLETSTSNRSGCIELFDSAGARWVRMYPGGGRGVSGSANAFVASSSNFTSGTSVGIGLLVIEVGRCDGGITD